MKPLRVVIVGGGAAGFFAAITCAEQAAADHRALSVVLIEKGPAFLSKVRISGGGRCNVTHACFDARDMATRYPRGDKALIGPYQRFQARDTVDWFESRGVRLKTEADGRMFPVTDSSQTIIDCLLNEARAAGVILKRNTGLESIVRGGDGTFVLGLSDGGELACDRVLLATGGCRAAVAGRFAVSLGHTLEPPVPSLFTFHVNESWIRDLAGISVDPVTVSVPGTSLRESGPILVTHSGFSGPAVLRLSAWGARELHGVSYRFCLHIDWLPDHSRESLEEALQALKQSHPARRVVNVPVRPLPSRLWRQLVLASGVGETTRWAELSRAGRHGLIHQLTRSEFHVTGKSLHQEEFVTCGGVRLSEVNFKTMESRICPGLFFAGELLDIDGITGGFNFQAAWTTGWIAGKAMAGAGAGVVRNKVS